MPSAKAALFYNEVMSLPPIPASSRDSLVILLYMTVLCILLVDQFLIKLLWTFCKSLFLEEILFLRFFSTKIKGLELLSLTINTLACNSFLMLFKFAFLFTCCLTEELMFFIVRKVMGPKSWSHSFPVRVWMCWAGTCTETGIRRWRRAFGVWFLLPNQTASR